MPSLFSFFDRIGRLEYFVGAVVVTVGAMVIGFILMMFAMALCTTRAGFGLAILIMGCFGLAVLWSTLSLQTRRCRDIGWNPLLLIGGWFALEALDVVLALLVPSLAIGKGFSVGLGPIVNLAMLAILLLWPGRAGGDVTPSAALLAPDLPRTRVEALRVAAAANAPERQSILARPAASAMPSGFGRRGIA